MTAIPTDRVAALLRELAASLVLPRFCNLQTGEIEEKSPGELVTVVDRAVELALAPRLAALVPGSRVIGEEACAADPGLIRSLDDGLVWLVDPIDGTANFAAGREHFAMMVALMRDGAALASWIHAPALGRMAMAEAGAGAAIDGRPLRVHHDPSLPAVVKTRFLPPELRQPLDAISPAVLRFHQGCGAAGIEYPDFTDGRLRFLMYWRTLAWDHVPGTLLAREAGAHVARLDGSPYRASDGRFGLLVAPDEESWRQVRSLLPP